MVSFDFEKVALEQARILSNLTMEAHGRFEPPVRERRREVQRLMALEMKDACERCHARLDGQGEACICSFECTFCPECAQALSYTCQNCGGELVRRPKRKVAGSATILDSDSIETDTVPAQCPVVG